MALSSIFLFVNTLSKSPQTISAKGRYVVVHPSHIGVNKIEKVLAIVKEDNAPINIEVDASTSNTNSNSIIFDTTLSLEYLIISEPRLGITLTSNFEIGSSSKKRANGDLNANIMIINSSSSDEETIFINPNSKHEASSSKTSTDVAYTSAVQLILNYPTKYRFFSKTMSDSMKVEKVDELPIDYNGNIIFELPPADTTLSPMDGMEQRCDCDF